MVCLVLSLEQSLSANISTVIMIMVVIEDGGFDAIDVNSSGGRDDLSEYCGGDHHGQIDRVHDVIFMVMMMICVG